MLLNPHQPVSRRQLCKSHFLSPLSHGLGLTLRWLQRDSVTLLAWTKFPPFFFFFFAESRIPRFDYIILKVTGLLFVTVSDKKPQLCQSNTFSPSWISAGAGSGAGRSDEVRLLLGTDALLQ